MIKTSKNQDELLKYLIDKGVDDKLSTNFNDLIFYDDIKEFQDDCRYLKEGKLIDFKEYDNFENVIFSFSTKKISNHLNSIEHKKYLILDKIAKKGKQTLYLDDLVDENINKEQLVMIVEDLEKKEYIKAQKYGYTTSKYPNYIIMGITFDGEKFLQNDSLLDDTSSNQQIYITHSILANNGANISIKDSFNNSKNFIENIEKISKEDKKEIIDKIDQIEKILKSNDKKESKKSKLKQIFIWLIEKSIDVGIAIVPSFF